MTYLDFSLACGSNSFDSYSDSYGLSRPLVSNNSQASFNVSNVSFNTSLDQNYGQSNHLSSSSSLLANNGNNYSGITTGAFISSGGVGVNYVTNKINNNSQSSSPSLNYNNQSSCNIQNLGNYSPNSNYDPPTPTNLNPPSPFMHHTSYSPSPNNYDHHHVNHHLQQMQLMDGGRMGGRKFDDQSKVSRLSLTDAGRSFSNNNLSGNHHHHHPINTQSNNSNLKNNSIILNQIQASKEIARASCRNLSQDGGEKETFYWPERVCALFVDYRNEKILTWLPTEDFDFKLCVCVCLPFLG